MSLVCFAEPATPPQAEPLQIIAEADEAETPGEEFTYEGLNYQVLSETERTCRTKPLEGYYSGNNASGDIVIPEKVMKDEAEYTVVAVGDGSFYSNSKLTGVVLPASVKTIGSNAFCMCSLLSSVSIPEGVTTIGDYAFQSSGISTVHLPASLTSVGKNPFTNCTKLTEFSVDEQNPVFVFADKMLYIKEAATGELPGVVMCMLSASGDLAIAPTAKTICDAAFRNCYRLTSVNIPQGVTSIGEYAFYFNSGLTSFAIPESVSFIGEAAFAYCSKLTSIQLPGILTSVSNNVFENCTALTDISLPTSVTSIGYRAFYNCPALTTIDLPSSLISVGEQAFNKCGLTSFVFPETVTEIGEYALAGCKSLTTVKLPDNITAIPNGLFNGCESIESFSVPEQITEIGDYAFSSCLSLKSIDIPDGVTEIKDGVFLNCEALESFEISDHITSLGQYVFADCDALKSIKIGNKVESIGNQAFRSCVSLTSVVLPNSVKTIDSSVFTTCSALESIDLGESLTTIGSYAFNKCTALTSVTIPATVNTISEKALFHCHGLKDIYVLNPQPIEIPENVFYCDRYERPSYAENYIYKNAALHVPAGSVEAYREDTAWGNFSSVDALPSLTLSEIPSAVYGDTAIDLAAFSPENADLIYVSSNPDIAAIDGNTLTITGAGEVTIVAERGESLPRYYQIENHERSFTVNKADLTATARSYTVAQGDMMPTFELDFDGFVNSDTADDIDELPTVTCPVSDTSVPGTYALVPTGGSDRNYNIININGELKIDKEEAGIRAVDDGSLRIVAEGGEIIVSGVAAGTVVEIYNASGSAVTAIKAVDNMIHFAPHANGIYIVKAGGAVKKVIL